MCGKSDEPRIELFSTAVNLVDHRELDWSEHFVQTYSSLIVSLLSKQSSNYVQWNTAFSSKQFCIIFEISAAWEINN